MHFPNRNVITHIYVYVLRLQKKVVVSFTRSYKVNLKINSNQKHVFLAMFLLRKLLYCNNLYIAYEQCDRWLRFCLGSNFQWPPKKFTDCDILHFRVAPDTELPNIRPDIWLNSYHIIFFSINLKYQQNLLTFLIAISLLFSTNR